MKLSDFFSTLSEPAKTAVDHVAAGTAAGASVAWVLALAQWAPIVAALLSCAWYIYRFYESFKAKREHKKDPALDE